jgi:RNA-directed DNA polymerase
MLKALETGLEGGKWFRLIDKVSSENKLRSVLRKVVAKRGSAGGERTQCERSGKGKSKEEIAEVRKQLRAGPYRLLPVKRVWLPEPGDPEKRSVGNPTVQDRIVQSALRHVVTAVR